MTQHTVEKDATGERRRAAFPPCTTQNGEHCRNCPRNTLAECVADLPSVENDRCVCDPDGPCLGVPGESDACDACLVLDPEESCLHDPETRVIPPGSGAPDHPAE